MARESVSRAEIGIVVDKSNKKVGRALEDEAELDDDALDAIVGGRGAVSPKPSLDEGDAWSEVVEDHSVAMPAKRSRSVQGSPQADGAAGTQRTKLKARKKR